MQLLTGYYGRSQVAASSGGASGGLAVSLAPNLRRDRVSFSGELQDPLRFREAVSALHAVVMSNLKMKVMGRSAYQAYLQRMQGRERALRETVRKQTQTTLLAEPSKIPPGLESSFKHLRGEYWDARQKYSNYLAKNDPALFRALVPCDPVITVAADVLMFEAFSKDESSYGCLSVHRDIFTTNRDVAVGTTNVDYSQALYEEFQRLRTYRPTRFAVDPAGFEVSTGDAGLREEKIDLPPSWLQGFCQLQAALSLPLRKVPITREALYSILAHLKKHRAKKSPRALRFELVPGKSVEIVLEPWEKRIVLHNDTYTGPQAETIRIWGRDRLVSLARLLPLMNRGEVYLLGTGLPSFWNIDLGPMRFLLGLSGWTANDWTSGGGALADLAPPVEPSEDLLGDIAAAFQASPAISFRSLRERVGATPHHVAAGLNRFALLGQVIHDPAAAVYRWRSILPVALSLKQVKINSAEAEAGKEIATRGEASVIRDETVAGLRAVVGKADGRDVEILSDADRRMIRGQCNCSHYFRFKLRSGPCRHMQALRRVADGERPAGSIEQWYRRVAGSAN
ncbi:SWIM zinc finger domain-containing protein [soil metagenome]